MSTSFFDYGMLCGDSSSGDVGCPFHRRLSYTAGILICGIQLCHIHIVTTRLPYGKLLLTGKGIAIAVFHIKIP
jgi:hypothetical protein